MEKAGRYHGTRGIVLALTLVLALWGARELYGQVKADALSGRLWNAAVSDAPTIIAEMKPYRAWVNPRLRDGLAMAEAANDPKKQLKFRLALLDAEPEQVDYLFERLLTCEAADFAIIREVLSRYKQPLSGALWDQLGKGMSDPDRRFRAACALAEYS